MNCIHDDIIQKYIDGEANPEEITLVEKHIAICNTCAVKIENQRRLATNVKKAINLLAKDSIEIPKFAIPPRHIKKHYLTTKRLSYIIAAACILLFVFVITQKKEMKNQNEIILEIGSAMDVDANRPVTQLPLVISIIDAKGNISEYFIK
ncbi:MAG: zf-HC2 domain-containing protein [Bacteroidales bacterium]|nr:zf-HC2 domain-containing protein [Bacteroidales bacterium]MDP3002050.1 zf-HC2 domain-containing protein [Bacteroidales bacterium]